MKSSWGVGMDGEPDQPRVTVLAVIGDEQTRALLPRVLTTERLIIANDLARGLSFAQSESPDVVFVDLTIENGAGLAMVHHMKAIAPETSVFAIATKSSLEAGAHAVALGGAGLLLLPLSGDELLNAVSAVKVRLAEKSARAALIDERERLRRLSGIKDPTTSAYSLSYYADVAARELYRAGRYGRRLSMMTILLDPSRFDPSWPSSRPIMATQVTEHLVKVAADPALIGRVDEDELHVLMPETDGIGAHALRRRFLVELGAVDGKPGRVDPRGVLMGISTFPHNGDDLMALTRSARRRAEASATSAVHALTQAHRGFEDMLEVLESAASASAGSIEPTAPQRLELPMDEVAALAAASVTAALRAGSALVIVAYRPAPNLFRSVRSALGSGGPGITLRVLDIRTLSPGSGDLEALCVFAEHGSYALLGRSVAGTFRGAHTSDPLFADALAVRLGRSAGANLFG